MELDSDYVFANYPVLFVSNNSKKFVFYRILLFALGTVVCVRGGVLGKSMMVSSVINFFVIGSFVMITEVEILILNSEIVFFWRFVHVM